MHRFNFVNFSTSLVNIFIDVQFYTFSISSFYSCLMIGRANLKTIIIRYTPYYMIGYINLINLRVALCGISWWCSIIFVLPQVFWQELTKSSNSIIFLISLPIRTLFIHEILILNKFCLYVMSTFTAKYSQVKVNKKYVFIYFHQRISGE